MKTGIFVTFEGIDGCGKSTQVAHAARHLEKLGIPHLVTREPGGTPLAEKIREVVLSARHEEMSDACELLLYLAARAQHVAEGIKPALERGNVVLCDRFQEATFAYQGFGRGFAPDLLRDFNGFATSGLMPDRTYVLDIPVECARERLRQSGKDPDRLESAPAEFYYAVREGYLSFAAAHPTRIRLLPGEAPIEQLRDKIVADLDSLLADQQNEGTVPHDESVRS